MLPALFKIVQWRYVATLMLVLLAGCGESSSGSKSGSDEDAALDTKMAEQVTRETPMVKIKAGKFIRGSNKEDTEGMQERYGFAAPLYQDEHPQAEIYLDDYWIDVYEVTNKAYKTYILSTRRMMPFAWVNNGYALSESSLQKMDVKRLRKVALDYFQLDMDTRKMDKPALIAAMLEQQRKLDKLPVGGVNWFDAREFCQWRSARLPTEQEWEKAARGPDGLEYPWGNEWDPTITNTGEDPQWEAGIAPVGSYERNKSPYGVYDLSGNVWEWVDAWYQPYENSTYKSDAFGKKNRVIRGGGGGIGHYSISYFYRAATRQFSEPQMESDDVGFRCARDA
ncbi:MAG: SUMF1/EgtB/PvdO family nonheme iron enzyme [Gammaproteobacteria bacterium]|jgi:formylglycine-generating enzyme required for sulfatase activity